jgi:hypothetical protein
MSNQATSSYHTGWWQMKDAVFLLPEIYAVIRLTESGKWPCSAITKLMVLFSLYIYEKINRNIYLF